MFDFDIEKLRFDDNGLIPAVVVDSVTKKVLTVAYMNKESLEFSMEKGLTCFYSRSRQELWLKGETSGNYQHIVSITADCDYDALTVVVEKDGPACHKGARWAIKRARQGAATTSIASIGERDDYVASRTAQNNRTADKFLFAGVAELADAQDLGSCVNSCRFKYCHPHHVKRP